MRTPAHRLGKGCVCLYDANSSILIGEWEHPKPVWCVRLSPDGGIVAAAGYDMKLTVYDTHSLTQLHQIAYTSKAGPAFIWSMDFSKDSKHLALGCWNTYAYLYRLTRDAAPTADSTEAGITAADLPFAGLTVAEAVSVQRTDRVYAVALDAEARHLAVAGRDKACALYERQTDGSMSILWETISADFIYSVALSSDLTYCVFGGMDKAAVVLDGRTGVQVCRINVPGAVWTISLLHDSTRLAVGGELPTITIYDLQQQKDLLQLPVDDITYAVCISNDALCFTNGHGASMYGRAGTGYAWRDPPSFGVVASLIMTMLANEDELLHCTSLIIDSHPAVVNSRDPDTGASLLQFVISNANRSRLLDVLLAATCRIGLQADARGRTCLHSALEQGKWHSLQQLLDALRHERFSAIPGSMRLVAECFEAIAKDYPLDFLHYIGNLPLQQEPEVLGDIDAFDVMLPSTLICGSTQRCPKGIWASKLAQYSRSATGRDEVVSATRDSTLTSFARESSRESSAAPPLLAEKSTSNGLRNSRSAFKRPASGGGATTSARPGSAAGPGTSQPGSRQAVQMSFKAATTRASTSDNLTVKEDAKVEMGYNKISRGGLQALRVPIENFAGLFEAGHSNSVSVAPLQLVVDAVSSTKDYTVFSSQLMQVLLEFKWYGFARARFFAELAFYCVHTTVVLVYNITLSASVKHNFNLPKLLLGSEPAATDAEGVPSWDNRCVIIVGWVWTSFMCVNNMFQEFQQMRSGFAGYISQPWNWIDWIQILGGATINTLLLLRDYAPDAIIVYAPSPPPPSPPPSMPPAPPAGSEASASAGASIGSGRRLHNGGLLFDGLQDRALRELKANRGSGGETLALVGETGSRPGWFLQISAIVVLTVSLRLLYFFRGNLRLGALTHTFSNIVNDIIPLMIFLIVFIIGFTASMMVLVMHELNHSHYPEWHDFIMALFNIVNLGVYAQSESTAAWRIGRSGPLLLIIYIVFMLMVQVIILNMLIAIMAESLNRVTSQATLVARYSKAQLILEYESAEIARIRRVGGRSRHARRAMRDQKHDRAPGLALNPLDILPSKEHARLERVCPRWLHVLMPADTEREGSAGAEELRQIMKLRKELQAAEESLSAKQTKLLEAVGSRDEAGERQKMLQALRVELGQLREDVVADMKGGSSGVRRDQC